MLLIAYPKELKTFAQTIIYTWIFISVLSIIGKTWKQARFPSVTKWIDKLWSIQTMGYQTVLKISEYQAITEMEES
jgi:hypothetical protein